MRIIIFFNDSHMYCTCVILAFTCLVFVLHMFSSRIQRVYLSIFQCAQSNRFSYFVAILRVGFILKLDSWFTCMIVLVGTVLSQNDLTSLIWFDWTWLAWWDRTHRRRPPTVHKICRQYATRSWTESTDNDYLFNHPPFLSWQNLHLADY